MGQIMRGCTERDNSGSDDWDAYIDNECKVLGYQSRDTLYQILQFNRFAADQKINLQQLRNVMHELNLFDHQMTKDGSPINALYYRFADESGAFDIKFLTIMCILLSKTCTNWDSLLFELYDPELDHKLTDWAVEQLFTDVFMVCAVALPCFVLQRKINEDLAKYIDATFTEQVLFRGRKEAAAKITQGLNEVSKDDFLVRARELQWLSTPYKVRTFLKAVKAGMES